MKPDQPVKGAIPNELVIHYGKQTDGTQFSLENPPMRKDSGRYQRFSHVTHDGITVGEAVAHGATAAYLRTMASRGWIIIEGLENVPVEAPAAEAPVEQADPEATDEAA